MLKFKGFLPIRASREMYASSGGARRQSNDFYALDTDTFELLRDPGQLGLERWDNGYVSHSFNRFLALLNGTACAVRFRQLDGEAVDVIDILGEADNN